MFQPSLQQRLGAIERSIGNEAGFDELASASNLLRGINNNITSLQPSLSQEIWDRINNYRERFEKSRDF